MSSSKPKKAPADTKNTLSPTQRLRLQKEAERAEAFDERLADGSMKRFYVDPEKLQTRDYRHIRKQKDPKGRAL